VVVQVNGAKHDGSNLKGNKAKALDALQAAIQEHGQTPPDGSPGFPDGVATASRDQWRDAFYAAVKVKEPNIKDEAFRKRLARATTELLDSEQIGITGERCWIT
jgi:hypothetical protein